MTKSAAKQRILEVTHNLIRTQGYATLNVNEIAHQAEVSIGTLYYHFPKGKSSILLETRAKMTDSFFSDFKKELEKEDYLKASKDFKDGLSRVLSILLRLHRKDRQFLIAMEGEILTNLQIYLEAIKNVELDDLFLEEINAFLHPIRELLKQFPREELCVEGKEKQLHKVIDTLIHRHIYFGYNFGTDEEFVDMLTKIVYALLKKHSS